MIKFLRKVEIIFFLLVYLPINLICQNEANNWVFGNGCGVSFNQTPPVTFYNSINSIEGCASISDSDGNLIFYTDGVRIWDRNNNLMNNGKDLSGHTSATQSALIIPKPLKTNEYYILTLEALESENIRLHYSIVDINLNNGYGDVIVKNHYLTDNLTEKLCGTRHSNGLYYWFVVHKWESNEFHSYLLTRDGINLTPIISKIGSFHNGSMLNKLGYMKISPNGEKLALAVFDDSFVEIFDFDKSSGRILNPVKIQMNGLKGIYGIEFSPDSKMLYVSTSLTPSAIFQLDLSTYQENAIKNSIKKISFDVNFLFGALQLAPDGKIYVANKLRQYLSAIDIPDSLNCSFTLNALFLGNNCQLGLPAFVSNIFQKVSLTANSPLCIGDTLFLNCLNCENYQLQWIGPDNFNSNDKNPIIINFNEKNVGMYYLKLISNDGKEIILSINVELYNFEVTITDNSSLDLNKVCLGMEKSKIIQIKNDSKFNIVIDKIRLKNANNYFLIDNPNEISLNAFEKFDLNVTFKPLSIGKVKDTLIISVESPCKEIYEFEVLGEGLDSKSYIRIPNNYYYSIGTKDTCLQIFANLNCLEDIFNDVDYEITVALNPYVFLIKSIQESELIENTIINGVQYIKIKGTVKQIDSNERVIAYLCGDALLGNNDTTSVFIEEFKWSNEFIDKITINGFIRVGDICQSNLRLIKKIKESEIIILSNIVNYNLNLLLKSEQSNDFFVRIYDVNTNIVFSDKISQSHSDPEYTLISLPTANLSNGIYFLTIQTANNLISERFIILK